MIQIVNEYPPNIAQIREHFNLDTRGEVYFTYGDAIYNPGGKHIDADFIYHEEVHVQQQKAAGGPEAWWKRYIEDLPFRYQQEIEAYGKQTRYIRRINPRRAYSDMNSFAASLASPLYGLSITPSEALHAIFLESMKGA